MSGLTYGTFRKWRLIQRRIIQVDVALQLLDSLIDKSKWKREGRKRREERDTVVFLRPCPGAKKLVSIKPRFRCVIKERSDYWPTITRWKTDCPDPTRRMNPRSVTNNFIDSPTFAFRWPPSSAVPACIRDSVRKMRCLHFGLLSLCHIHSAQPRYVKYTVMRLSCYVEWR